MTSTEKRPTAPRDFCTPETFGQLHPEVDRIWWKPSNQDDPLLGLLYGAVFQCLISLRVRDAKNLEGHPLAWLSARDLRGKHEKYWGKVLNGYQWLHPADMALLYRVLPDALPSVNQVAVFTGVADGSRPRPMHYPYADR